MKPLRDGEPREIGPYRLLAELGEGGMGRVLLATASDGKLAALKVMRPHLLHDDRFRFRFRREVITSREVAASRWTATVVASDEHAPEPWLASEFFHGPTLAEAIAASGPLDEPAARRLMHGLASALAEIHSHGVVHRDLKPSNVILTEDGVRLIDFGIARVPGGSGDTTITETGALIGAPAHMSPEQITKRPVGPPTDLFSLGTTVINAATGANPFEAEALFDIMNKVVSGTTELDALPEGLRSLVAPCMTKDPGERITAAELLTRIGEPLAGPWPPGVTALDEMQRVEVASMARRHGWETRVQPDRTVLMYGPGIVHAAEAPGGPAYQYASGPAAPAFQYPGGPSAPNGPGSPHPNPGGPAFQYPAGMPGPVPLRPKQDRTVLYGIVAVIAVVALASLLFLIDRPEDDDPATIADGSTTSDSDGTDPGAGGEDDTEPVEATTDPVADAAVGDCFYDYGDADEADLEAATCGDGTFTVVDIYYDTTDLSMCDGTDDLTTSVSDSASRTVLCLSYQHSYGDAYHAEVGECVFGPDDDVSPWYQIECQTGAFEVLERLTGQSDMDACTDSTYYNHGFEFTTDQSYLDVVLCLQFIYPDDAGYAELDDCMYMDGDPAAGAYYWFSDCDSANVYVTGRTDEYEAGGFCGDDGWTTWSSPDFAVHTYTVCWRYL
ncbi:serine/threonine protein kinase [Glycomyces harbinensis]|uniref:Serine/threonine protein kinase n=1 Tax=Glycomyces harbinensis TaxID=58114 RepID=A0A1G6YPT1_9ACTN|nr:serine/threonine-protein kinase [Glycomyces harbinensis]SDD92302.1 Serine/threonine protein kinase [Glycomyces harbinensis]